MTSEELLPRIRALGNPGTARVLRNHGAHDPVWGAKIGDMKPLIKGIRSDPVLARGLFLSGVYDAMYLAALVVHGADLDGATLDAWARLGYGGAISENTVPWLAAEHPEGLKLALKWIDSPVEAVACSGWATLGGLASLKGDADLDLGLYRRLLDRAAAGIPGPGRVRQQMAAFVILTAVYVEPLRAEAQAQAEALGPAATGPIAKALARGPVRKKKTLKC